MANESLLLGGMQVLRDIGFFDFFLPFILFFAIIYGALDKTKVFGEGRKDINSIIALVIALIASTTSWVLKGVAGFLPWVGFIALVIVAFLMLVAMVYGGDVQGIFDEPWLKRGATIGILIALGLGIFYGLGLNERLGGAGSFLTETDIALIVLGIIFITAFAIISKGGSSE